MSSATETHEVLLEPVDNRLLANLCGQFDEHLRQIEKRLGVHISNRGNHFRIMGPAGRSKAGVRILRELYKLAGTERLDPQRVHMCLQESSVTDDQGQPSRTEQDALTIKTHRLQIRPRGKNQRA